MRSALILIGIWCSLISNAYAAELGRLFYSPEQRAQLESQIAIGNTEGETKRNFIMVNGVIQKQGGNRIVWINKAQQPVANGNENAPATVSVNVPGKTRPVQLKVGQRLLLDAQPAENVAAKTSPAKPSPKLDDE